jgi:hypothetical protein
MILSDFFNVFVILLLVYTFRRQIRDGWDAARAVADQYNDQYDLGDGNEED